VRYDPFIKLFLVYEYGSINFDYSARLREAICPPVKKPVVELAWRKLRVKFKEFVLSY